MSQNIKYHTNFPIGMFINPKLKYLVKSYCDIIYFAKNIVDNPSLPQEQKEARISAIRNAFMTPNSGADLMNVRRLGNLFVEHNLDASLFLDLLTAFERDIAAKPFRIWEELVDYCRYLASPIGRFMLAIHDESPSAYLPAETLCVLLQIINKLCNIKHDLSLLNRVYIPQDMLARHQITINDLGLTHTAPEISKLISEITAKLENMQTDTLVLPALIKNFLLRFEICVILSLTNSMIQKIKNTDILQQKPSIGLFSWLKAFAWASVQTIRCKYLKQGRVL